MIQDEIMKLQTYKMFEGEDTVYVERDDVLEVLKQQPCEDALSPTVEPVGLEEAKKLIYQEWKSKVAEDNPNQRLLVAYQIAMKALEQEPCEDCISRQAVLDCLTATGLKKFDFILDARYKIKNLPSVTPQPKIGWNNHQIACMLADLFGDACACNYNGIDEWLSELCDFKDTCCPNPVGVACWEQFLKHRAERRTDE